jgi:hypothetical protein
MARLPLSHPRFRRSCYADSDRSRRGWSCESTAITLNSYRNRRHDDFAARRRPPAGSLGKPILFFGSQKNAALDGWDFLGRPLQIQLGLWFSFHAGPLPEGHTWEECTSPPGGCAAAPPPRGELGRPAKAGAGPPGTRRARPRRPSQDTAADRAPNANQAASTAGIRCAAGLSCAGLPRFRLPIATGSPEFAAALHFELAFWPAVTG